MKEKNLNVNLILNSIKVLMSIIYPFITFPYVSRVLLPTQIGEYDYAHSWINYFVLIAGLGVATYAVRSGTSLRENKEAFSDFVSEVFSLNLLATLFSYVLLGICFICFDTFYEYRVAILLFSITILFKTIGVDWLFGIFEDYKYITLRSILFQLISIAMMFLLVRDTTDLYIYIAINVLAVVGTNICNFIYAGRFCKIRLVINRKVFSHLKPVLIIFSTTLATMIYINSDTTMLGLMRGTEEVGFYAVACKMYNCIKSLLNGMVAVFMARLSYQFAERRKEYNQTFRYAFQMLTFLTIPLAIGALFYSRDIILIMSGEEYLQAESAMKLLFCSLVFATLGNLYSSGGLLLAGKEKVMLIATAVGAVFNIAVNYILIPILGCTGAAVATCMTEVFICMVLFVFYKKYVGLQTGLLHVVTCIIASLPFCIIKEITLWLGLDGIIFRVIGIAVCVAVYFIILLLIKNEFMCNLYRLCKQKIQSRR